jgi:hypothetical protein
VSTPGRSARSSVPDLSADNESPPDREPYRPYAAFMCRKIRDFVLYQDSKDKQLRAQAAVARDWLTGEGPSADVWEGTLLQFEDVCVILDLPIEETRQKILTLRRSDFMTRMRDMKKAGRWVDDGA